MYFLTVAVALVLLIGCLNVANLLLPRAMARRHQLSVQVAVGASRWRLVRQHLTESVTLAAASAVLGIMIAAFAGPFLVEQLSTPTNPVFLDVSVERRVLLFTVLLTTLTALLFGTAPAYWATRIRATEALNEKGRSVKQSRGRVMEALVAVQVALSVVLIVAAGLFVRSFSSLATRDLGFHADPVLVVTIDPEAADIEPARRPALYAEIRSAVRRLPNVGEAAVSYRTPVGGGGFTPAIEIASDAGPTVVAPNGDVFGNLLTPGWFATFGTPVIAGRDFTDGDRTGAPKVGIVNEAFARRFFDGESPIGRIVTVYPNTARAQRLEIVGLAADAIYSSPRDPVPPSWYAPLAQFDVAGFPFAPGRLSVQARTGSPALLTKSVVAAVGTVNPRLALTFRPLGDQIRASLTRERLLAQLAGFFGMLGMLLAGLGLYGVTAYAVSQQRSEIGIRMALGASSTRLTRTVLTRVVAMLCVGIGAGTAVCLWASRFVSGLIHGLPPGDPATLLGASALLAAIGVLAGWLPTRRAVRINPLTALREN